MANSPDMSKHRPATAGFLLEKKHDLAARIIPA